MVVMVIDALKGASGDDLVSFLWEEVHRKHELIFSCGIGSVINLFGGVAL